MSNGKNNKETMSNTTKKTIVKETSKKVKITKFDDLEGKFLHVQVGNADSPASTEQISDIQKKIVNLFVENDVNCLAFVTHHAVSINIIEKEIAS